MAIYLFRQSVISGGAGHSAVAAAAYRHNAAMHSDRFHTIEDYSRRQGTVHSEIAIPGDAPAWVRADLGFAGAADADGSRLSGAEAVHASQILWNAVELGEKRHDAKYAHEVTLALPVELTEAQNVELVRAFVDEQFTAKGRIADWAYHLPPGREHNPHVHILSTVRPLAEQGFGPKASIARDADGDPIRTQRGEVVYEKWAGSKDDLYEMRAAWAAEVNQALALAGHDITVDHRSFVDRGITDIQPTHHRGKTEHMVEFGAHHQVPTRDAEDRSATFARFVENPSLVLTHITREQSTFDMRDVARTLHRYMGAGDDFPSLMARVGALPELVAIQAQIHDPHTNRIVQHERFTTEAVLQREAAMLDATLSRLADRGYSVDDAHRDSALLRAEERQGFAYSPEQRAAIDRLTRDEGIGVMVGIAGAGKSTVMAGVNEIYSASGAAVYGAALAGKAADNLQASSGIESRTLASWEHAWANGYDQLQRGDVFVIDEAGMVASAQMGRVMDQLNAYQAKVILVGDARQLQPIEAGAAFRSIAAEVGYVELTEVRRQERDDHAEASILFGAGQARSAMDIYKGNDTFQFHDARSAALSAAITGWEHDRRAGADVVMLAHTNRDVLDLNAMARTSIKGDGGLVGGDTFLTARGPREFAPGDRVLFLDNDRALGVRNGSIGTVEAISTAGITIALPDHAEPVQLTRGGYNNIDHGYATTIHKSQGSTFDRVHVVAGGMMDAQLSYVSLSRHREEVTFHIPLDAFTRPGAALATPDMAMDRLATEKLKDTSIDFRKTPDYVEAEAAIEARQAQEQSAAARYQTFLEQRGLMSPSEALSALKEFASEVMTQVKAFAAEFLDRNGRQDPAQQIRVDAVAIHREASQAAALSPHEDIRASLNRLHQVQDHSAAMNHEGNARRSAFFTAENELTRYGSAERLRDYAEAVAAVVPLSTVVAIGPVLADAAAEPRLAALTPIVREALAENWRDVHAVARASWELGMLETVRGIDTSYRQERGDQRVLADYERMTQPQAPVPPGMPIQAPPIEIDARIVPNTPTTPIATDPERVAAPPQAPFIAAVTAWSQTVEQAAAGALPTQPNVAIASSSLQQEAAQVWRDPVQAVERIRAEIAADPSGINAIHQNIQKAPHSYGELLGGRTVFMQPDGDRREALSHLPSVASAITYLVRLEDRIMPVLVEREQSWRDLVASPVPALSPDAKNLMSSLVAAHDMKQTDREQGHQAAVSALSNPKALDEIKTFHQEVEKRMALPDAAERIPGMTPEKREEVKSVSASAEVAIRTADMTAKVEQSREKEQDKSKGHDRDAGMGR